MPNIITFSVVNQKIRRTDELDVVADSQNYLTAKFNFETFQWEGLTKTALFRIGTTGTVYGMVLDDDDTCEVPHEVLAEGGHYIHVSVFAGDLITANVAKVFVQKSGYWSDAESSTEPTPSVYQQIIDKLDETKQYVDTKTQNIDGGLFTDWRDG